MNKCIREELTKEIVKCRGCKIYNNKVKKANDIFPDCIIDNILSFVCCKRCTITKHLMKNEPANLEEMDKWIWYMTRLNKCPTKKSLRTIFTTGLDKALKEYGYDNRLILHYGTATQFHYNLLFHNNDGYVSCKKISISMCRDFLKMLKWQYIENKDKVVYKNIFDNKFYHKFVCHLLEKKRLIIDWFNYMGTVDSDYD